MVQAIRIKSFDGLSSTSKTFSSITPRTSVSEEAKLASLRYLGQRIVSLTTRTYGSTDYIITYSTDTEGGE